jgi:DNA-directed RNA polymerase subunit RPC12/RpoP
MLKKSTFVIALGIALILLKLITVLALAQSDSQIYLSLEKVVGYKSGFWSNQLEAQGILIINAAAPSSVTRVIFYIDDTVMGEVSQAPFKLQFDSADYRTGVHNLTARGFSSDGSEVGTAALTVKFVTTAESINAGLLIAVPLAVVVILISSISWYTTRTKRHKLSSLPAGAPRQYGSAGGAICGRCGRPFPLRHLSPNLVNYKLERCPYCGRFGFARLRSLDELRRAEAAELETDGSPIKPPTVDVAEKLRRSL